MFGTLNHSYDSALVWIITLPSAAIKLLLPTSPVTLKKMKFRDAQIWGAEAVLGAFIGGFEVKYLTTGYESQLFYTPHAGLTFEGIWSLMYGRNYPNDTSFMGQVSKHQLTFVMRIYPM